MECLAQNVHLYITLQSLADIIEEGKEERARVQEMGSKWNGYLYKIGPVNISSWMGVRGPASPW